MSRENVKSSNADKPKTGSALKRFLKFMKKNPSFTVGLVIMIAILFVAIFAKQIAPNDPYKNNPRVMLMKPFTDWQYPLGTDYIGRCLLSRMIYGIRTSLMICVTAVGGAVILGVLVGILSGNVDDCGGSPGGASCFCLGVLLQDGKKYRTMATKIDCELY